MFHGNSKEIAIFRQMMNGLFCVISCFLVFLHFKFITHPVSWFLNLYVCNFEIGKPFFRAQPLHYSSAVLFWSQGSTEYELLLLKVTCHFENLRNFKSLTMTTMTSMRFTLFLAIVSFMIGKVVYSWYFFRHCIATDEVLFNNQKFLDNFVKKNQTWIDAIEEDCYVYLAARTNDHSM